MMFPYTEDVMNEYPYVVESSSVEMHDMWSKYRWLTNDQKLTWGEDFIAIITPQLATNRKPLYDKWAFKDEKYALLFTLKWT